MFQFIAIRPLDGCFDHIRKCLKKNVFYYLCDDYRIDCRLGLIKLKSTNLEPLSDDFFLNNPKVSISAIVGKNGDGKSSLIELMTRLVNNASITNKLMAETNTLRWVEGVRAELYYMVDNILFVLRQIDDEKGALVFEIADLRDQKQTEWSFHKPRKVDIKQDRDAFFFTFVSN